MITKIKYNLSHDQLILAGDTATFLNLYRFASVSSTPKINIGAEIFGNEQIKQTTKEDINDSFGYDNDSNNDDDDLQIN